MEALNYRQAQFFISAATLEQCPSSESREVAFIGRSNSGKSSALNALTGNSKLARTSKTPGRTRLINFFMVHLGCFLVDLPGYGYAGVSKQVKQEWQKQLSAYINYRVGLQGIVLLMDIRHPLKESDLILLKWSAQSAVNVHILLTKADKLKRGAARTVLLRVVQQCEKYPKVGVQLFSSVTKSGVDELACVLNSWLL